MNLARAEAYYQAVGSKNLELVKEYLHPQVTLSGPLAKIEGKKNVLKSTSHYMNLLETLEIKSVLGGGSQVSVVYEITSPGLVEHFLASVLLKFEEGLIISLNLFYDPRPFLEKQGEIFSSK